MKGNRRDGRLRRGPKSEYPKFACPRGYGRCQRRMARRGEASLDPSTDLDPWRFPCVMSTRATTRLPCLDGSAGRALASGICAGREARVLRVASRWPPGAASRKGRRLQGCPRTFPKFAHQAGLRWVLRDSPGQVGHNAYSGEAMSIARDPAEDGQSRDSTGEQEKKRSPLKAVVGICCLESKVGRPSQGAGS